MAVVAVLLATRLRSRRDVAEAIVPLMPVAMAHKVAALRVDCDRRPVDLIRMGRAEELMRAIRAERSDTFA